MFNNSFLTVRPRWLSIIAVVALLGLTTTACSDDGTSGSGSGDASASASEPGGADDRSVESGEDASDGVGADPTDDDADSDDMPDGDTVDDGEGDAAVDNRTIVVLDEYTGLTLLSLGVVPDVVYGPFASYLHQEILTNAGVEVIEQADPSTVDFEGIAASEPDMILVSSEGGTVSRYEPLEEIAPITILAYDDPWRDQIHTTAIAVGAETAAAELISSLEAKIAEINAAVAENATSVSAVGSTSGFVFAVSPQAVLSQLIEEAGFERPDAQANGEPFPGYESIIGISTEVLDQHDADFFAVLDGVYYDSTSITEAPTYADLTAVQNGRGVLVNGEMWFGTSPFAIYWTLADLEAMSAGDATGIADESQAASRWAEFSKSVE